MEKVATCQRCRLGGVRPSSTTSATRQSAAMASVLVRILHDARPYSPGVCVLPSGMAPSIPGSVRERKCSYHRQHSRGFERADCDTPRYPAIPRARR